MNSVILEKDTISMTEYNSCYLGESFGIFFNCKKSEYSLRKGQICMMKFSSAIKMLASMLNSLFLFTVKPF